MTDRHLYHNRERASGRHLSLVEALPPQRSWRAVFDVALAADTIRHPSVVEGLGSTLGRLCVVDTEVDGVVLACLLEATSDDQAIGEASQLLDTVLKHLGRPVEAVREFYVAGPSDPPAASAGA